MAWHSEKNPTAIAKGHLKGNILTLTSIEPALTSVESIINYLVQDPQPIGIAIDAPLIINNIQGQRECEKALSKDYGSRKASCHTSNQTLYPNTLSVQLANGLLRDGYKHLSNSKWLIECYPHPAIIECFDLPERLLYKKGTVAEKKAGQIKLAELILQLSKSDVLALTIPSELTILLNPKHIKSLKGKALKTNEDALDAIICLYIAGLYQIDCKSITYGDVSSGYIWTPLVKAI
ncbi:DUF429 domain-containing protein [Pseudoalteromonas sp. P1-9]|uniref:DUF429 domain-containing protein n=1 Tax=Pseudoalteromonas sp. P1-9 TaxID=1710354 RepID=UPI001F4631EE|nr:DUF429 domain-containing protein [Pseudoalteromonas sp. P1-9]